MRQLSLTAEENFIEAMEEAKRCDAESKEAIRNGTQESLPSSHGIPIFVKDVVIYGFLNFSTNKKQRDVQLALSIQKGIVNKHTGETFSLKNVGSTHLNYR